MFLDFITGTKRTCNKSNCTDVYRFGQKKKEPESLAQAIDGGRRDYPNICELRIHYQR